MLAACRRPRTRWRPPPAAPTVCVAALAAVFLPAASAPAAAPVDWVELAVDDETLTHSEFVAQARFLLAWQQPGWAAGEPLAPMLAGLVRDTVIASMLVAAQARALGIDELTDEEVDALVDELAARRPELPRSAMARNLVARHHRNARLLGQRLAPPGQDGGAGRADDPGGLLWLGEANEDVRAYVAELYRTARVRARSEGGTLQPPLPP